ncbi:ATP-binding protein [Paenibacillus sp. YYML68]|uniref:ATP-binding protein n=1 Tax=Paenibacillus sp. YYML68 TaxID=2909250 RepID=UPI00248F7102|nr:ATP-binding protein [Paenibacillus sp. YYML68]
MSRYLRLRIIPLLALALLLLLIGLEVQRMLLSSAASQPKASAGVLELDDWDWEQQPIVRLNGQWEFYWMELLGPGEFLDWPNPVEDRFRIASVPGSWNAMKQDGQLLSGQGYATYRLRVRLDERLERPLAVKLPVINTAYQLWMNGKLEATVGVVGTSADYSRPGFMPQLTSGDRYAEELELVLQVSNFDHVKGGLLQAIELGTFREVARKKELQTGFDTLLVGSLLIMGLYHIGVYAVRRKELSSLFFGILCLLFAFRMMLLGEIVLTKLFPDFNWDLELMLEYMSAAMMPPMFVLFFACIYPEESSKRLNLALCAAVALYVIVLLFLKPMTFTKLLWIMQLLVVCGLVQVMVTVTLAFMRKREGGGLILMSCFIFGVSILNDILYAHEWIDTTDRMAAFGLLVFIFCQAVLLSMKLSRAFVNEEKLSAELAALNNGLQERVRARTDDLMQANAALRRTNEELFRLETSRSHLISNISHDLGTPLTTIQCYTEAILDGMVDQEEQRERYLRMIHSKVLGMNRLIEDLFQLSRLEARQVEFKLQLIAADRLMQLLFHRMELEARNAGIRYELTMRGLMKEYCGEQEQKQECFSSVSVDLERLHQVYSNLLVNAVKFTPAGGSITVELQDNGKEMVCRMTDTGDGISSEHLPYVFDRFYTSNQSRNMSTGGKGLGLSIAKEIIEAHGGEIWIERTEPGEGTVFCFSLPVQPHVHAG